MHKTVMNKIWIIVSLFLFSSASAQTTANIFTPTPKPIIKDSAAQTGKEKKVVISGMMIARYAHSFDEEVDVNGKYHAGEDKYATSSFALRRARIQARMQMSEKAEAAVLLNLTDFSGNPANKVLEIATVKYKFNDYVNLQIGQFRPYFGREDLYPEELLQSLEWSNQYYAFGANGWQSFQAGATVYGQAKLFSLPVKYYIGMFNGNGRNQLMDNDNGKLFPARLELGVRPNTKLGLNGGVGRSHEERVWAVNADIDHIAKLGGPWELEIQSEYKYGTNNSLFDTSSAWGKLMKDYMISGYYILPNLKYNINSAHIKSIEFSSRYERLTCDVKREGVIRKTCMPMICCQLADEYPIRLELGMIVDSYDRNPLPESDRNNCRFVCQVKARF